MWVYMPCLFQMRKLRLSTVKSVAKCTEGSVCELKPTWSHSHPRILVGGWSWKRKKGEVGWWGSFCRKLYRKGGDKLDCDDQTLEAGAEEGTPDRKRDEEQQRTLCECYSQWAGRWGCLLSCLDLHAFQGTSLPLYPTWVFRPGRKRLFSTGLLYSRESPGTQIFSHFHL